MYIHITIKCILYNVYINIYIYDYVAICHIMVGYSCMIFLTWILANSTPHCLRSSSRNENQLHVTFRLPRWSAQAVCENVLVDVDTCSS